MPSFIVPSSNGEDATPLRERNDCREPGGRPTGGRFAPKGSGDCSPTADRSLTPVPTARMAASRLARARGIATEGDFDVQAAIDAAGPSYRKTLDRLYTLIPAAQTDMIAKVGQVLNDVGGQSWDYEQIYEGTGIRGIVAGPKGIKRIVEKSLHDDGGNLTKMRDSVRGSIAVDSPEQVPAVLAALRNRMEVVRVKDRFAAPIAGYRDMLINVRLANGLVGEVQIHVKPMLKAKETRGHKLYVEVRRLKNVATQSAQDSIVRLNTEMRTLYSQAWMVALVAAGAAASQIPAPWMMGS